MRTHPKTVQVVGALILAAFALFAVGCSKPMDPVIQPNQGEMFTGR
ncbi:hypothetical protein [Mycobacterium sp. TY814]|nr:hypothetical protein [Mycobacterium sp. TY814]MDP7721600.1 hypothetical protein [Mycobacterium sp. TY814]